MGVHCSASSSYRSACCILRQPPGASAFLGFFLFAANSSHPSPCSRAIPRKEGGGRTDAQLHLRRPSSSSSAPCRAPLPPRAELHFRRRRELHGAGARSDYRRDHGGGGCATAPDEEVTTGDAREGATVGEIRPPRGPAPRPHRRGGVRGRISRPGTRRWSPEMRERVRRWTRSARHRDTHLDLAAGDKRPRSRALVPGARPTTTAVLQCLDAVARRSAMAGSGGREDPPAAATLHLVSTLLRRRRVGREG
jgi:hypothetical protein